MMDITFHAQIVGCELRELTERERIFGLLLSSTFCRELAFGYWKRFGKLSLLLERSILASGNRQRVHSFEMFRITIGR